MKAILLAGGKGTRLRPLTINTPKPIVPILEHPFLLYQLALLKEFSEIDEVIISLNYQPDRIQEIINTGPKLGLKIRYIVEPVPLGTAGGIKFASKKITDTIIVLNGDVLTKVDFSAVVKLHRDRKAKATIVLTPVENPGAYGLVETDAENNVQRFIEKPPPDQISTNNINAGIYILEPNTFNRIPVDMPWSIERSFFPSLLEQKETFLGFPSKGYWIDIGTPAMYMKVHRDIMEGRFQFEPFLGKNKKKKVIAPDVNLDNDVTIQGPCYIARGVKIEAGVKIGPYSVIGPKCHIAKGAKIEASILWKNTYIGRESRINNVILGQNCNIGHGIEIATGTVLGDNSSFPDSNNLSL